MVCHRFCPQALAEALKVNKTLTKIDLQGNDIDKEGAKAWCLGRGSVAPGFEMVNENGAKWCTSGVGDFWDISGVGQVLRCLGVGPLDLSKSLWNGMEGRCKWDGGENSETCKAREKFQASKCKVYSQKFLQIWIWSNVFFSVLSWPRELGFNVW